MERSGRSLYEHSEALPTEAENVAFYRGLSREERLSLHASSLESNFPETIRENQAKEADALRKYQACLALAGPL